MLRDEGEQGFTQGLGHVTSASGHWCAVVMAGSCAALRQVERHLVNGDYVLFNRQPSLHKMSMMVRAQARPTFHIRFQLICSGM